MATKIVTIGDSWASFIANGAPGTIINPAQVPNSNVFQQVLDSRGSGAQVYNGGFYGGLSVNHVAQLGDITNIINAAGPDVDIVYLSSGGNDFLAGLLAGGWYRGKPANEVQALFDAVGNNVQTIANHILSLRPDIQVVIASYDYINVWDFNLTSGGDNVRLNLGLVRSGNWAVDLLQNADFNAALRDLETRKAAIGASSSRIHHVDMFGRLHQLVGYKGYLSNNAQLPPGFLPDMPVNRNLLGSGGNDPIHLNDTGYFALVDTVYSNFLGGALQNGTLNISNSFLTFGNVRVGTSAAQQQTTLSNSGVNFSKVDDINVLGVSSGFTGGGFGLNPLFRDPTLGSDSANVSYGFSPTTRGNANHLAMIQTASGTQNVQLTGKGVGPVFSGPGSFAIAPVRPSTQTTASLAISNTSTDGNLGALTDLTITGASFSGPDAGLFQLDGFVPGMSIDAASLANLTVRFLGGTTARTYDATLTLFTDQGAVLGGAGQSFNIAVSAEVSAGVFLWLGVDPQNALQTSLFAEGWTGNDSVQFAQLTPTSIQVTVTKENGVTVNKVTTFTGVTGRVIADGGAGDDELNAVDLTTTSAKLTGGLGMDSIHGGRAIDDIDGGDDDDLITGGLNADLINGGDGNDTIYGEHTQASGVTLSGPSVGSDTILGGDGNDLIYGDGDGGEGAADSILGGEGDDTIIGDGTLGAALAGDTILGEAGNDTIYGDVDGGEGAADSILGGAGNDWIYTGGGNDFADGGTDHDILLGGDGAEGANDTLLGGDGRDILVGDRGSSTPNKLAVGADSLEGGAGEDILIAGIFSPPDALAILAIQAEWLSGRSYAERVDNIRGTGVGPRLNDDYFLVVGDTVKPDTSNPPAVDDVLGGADVDWYFAGLEDNLIDQGPGEELDPLV